MSQKVWIGEDDAEFWDDLNKFPGNLLAEFKGHVYKSDLKKCQDGESDLILFHTPPITGPENRQPVRVLILEEK